MSNQEVNDNEVINQTDKNKREQSENTAENQQEFTEKQTEETENADNKRKIGKKKKASKNDELEKIEKVLEETRYKLSDINDRYIRLSAEFDNYRKRTLKEKTDMIKTAGGLVLADVLPIIDDFERALSVMDKAIDIQAVKEGVDLIYNKFKDFVKAKGIVEIDALHQEFDTDLHEALTKITAPEEKLKGKVVDVIQQGY